MHIDILDCVGERGGDRNRKSDNTPHRHRYHTRGGDIVTVS